MGSSKFKARTNFILEGQTFETGSVQEQMALMAFRSNQQEKYFNTLLIVKSIFHAAGLVSAAVTGGNAPSSSDLQELLNSYKTLLMPEYKEEQEERAKKVQEIMEKENEIGSFEVSALNYISRPKKGFR